mgnify:CR=1 FL=1
MWHPMRAVVGCPPLCSSCDQWAVGRCGAAVLDATAGAKPRTISQPAKTISWTAGGITRAAEALMPIAEAAGG